jgi:hypothetical protein
MRSVLALWLLIALCASANAAARGHHAKSRDVIVRPSHAVIPSYAAPGGVRIYRDDSVPGGLRTDQDDPPAYESIQVWRRLICGDQMTCTPKVLA